MVHVTTRSLVVFGLSILNVVCVAAQKAGDVRLLHGSGTSGVVQAYKDSWGAICGWNFRDQEAAVICRQLGFRDGVALPLAAFGDQEGLESYPDKLTSCAADHEGKLTECEFETGVVCEQIHLAYASVQCFNEKTPQPDVNVTLARSGPGSQYFSTLLVYGYHTWGHICPSFWEDNDATVACKQLGFAGGVASTGSPDLTTPFLVFDIDCVGNESSLEECQREMVFCYDTRTAAVVCYNDASQGPKIELVGGKANYGSVVLSVDGRKGLICNNGYHGTEDMQWSSTDGGSVCRGLGYVDGYTLSENYPTPGISEVLLEGVQCEGNERSLFMCQHGVWRNITSTCQNTSRAVAVYCYTTVRLISAVKEREHVHMGGVLMFTTNGWTPVCAEAMYPMAARVVCRQLGFSSVEILLPSSFFKQNSRQYVTSVTCTGIEDDVTNCTFTLGPSCPTYREELSILCKQTDVQDDLTLQLSSDHFGKIIMERFGVSGTVCRKGWDDRDATVVCRAAGFQSGIQIGHNVAIQRYEPVWASDFTCSGVESALTECVYQSNMSRNWACADDLHPAAALCFLGNVPDTRVRLVDGPSGVQGRAEVYNDVSGWGTICRYDWSRMDARVFCREAGFADGQDITPGSRNDASDDTLIVLSNVKCEGTETSIFHCPSNGWRNVPSRCSHSLDAHVFCYTYVKTDPSDFYGVVLFHSGDSYGLVCASTFDQNAANVVCRKKNYLYAKLLSTFGPRDEDFTMTGVRCLGNEGSLTECSYDDEVKDCPGGRYASVVCSSYQSTTPRLSADPVVKVSYFTHNGYVCSERFTDDDATVVCRQKMFTYGHAYKASGVGYETQIRWLQGLGCTGSETSFLQCGPHQWGQLGTCSWDSVAAVVCSNSQETLNVEVRLANGTDTTGRVEIRIGGVWGTICGRDITKREAAAICTQLGYHDGITLATGSYGAGSGDVLLSGMKCEVGESHVLDCVWSRYQGYVPCDHTEDLAVQCFYNTRLVGSNIDSYGRLEVYDSDRSTWVAVCDRNVNVNNVIIICRQLGYNDGIHQTGSPLGPVTTDISVVDMDCPGGGECSFTYGRCESDRYIAVYCSRTSIIEEYLSIRLPLDSFYGPLSVRRYGLWGHVCSTGFDDQDALVVCSQLGYLSGYALKTFAEAGYPVIQGNVRCAGTESKFSDCMRGTFSDDLGCYGVNTVAGVICYNEPGISLYRNELNPNTGRMTSPVAIQGGDKTLYVEHAQFSNTNAAVYCSAVGYPAGQSDVSSTGVFGVRDMQCTGEEETILQCPAVWDPSKTQDSGPAALAGVTCYPAVYLEGGNYTWYGAVVTSKDTEKGLVCADGFDEKDADIACRNTDHDHGLVLCCSAVGVGVLVYDPIITNLSCDGSQKFFSDCPHDDVDPDRLNACKVDYAAVACFSGEKPSEYSLKLPASADSSTGPVILTYLGIDGGVCMDGWDDSDAAVACKEIGYRRGVAYTSSRNDQRVMPFWTSNVDCQGTESKLADCPKTEIGKVRQCSNHGTQAGVICYNEQGIFYRLYGTGESRYGRVEVSLNGEWRSLCNIYWHNEDAHVLCNSLGFSTGEAQTLNLNVSLGGPVWETNFACSGEESSLNDCVSSGWWVATNPGCVKHEKDAGAFCYATVKLSTGVGRETNKGAVLVYTSGTWHSVCGEFDDRSAKVVCRELGFKDGVAECCSPYGSLAEYPNLLDRKIMCKGNEQSVSDCLVEGSCNSNDYASVICYNFPLQGGTTTPFPTDTDSQFDAIPVVIAIVVFIILVLVAIIVTWCVIKHRRQKKLEASKQEFDEAIVSRQRDGSLQVTNRLHGVVDTPEVTRVVYSRNSGSEPTASAQSVNHGRSGGEGSDYIFPVYSNPGYNSLDNEGRVIEGRQGARGDNRRAKQFSRKSDDMVSGKHESHVYDNIQDVEPSRGRDGSGGSTHTPVQPGTRRGAGSHVYMELSEQTELGAPTQEPSETN